MIDISTQVTTLASENIQKQTEYDRLKKVAGQLASGATDDMTHRVALLDKRFSVSDIMESIMINKYTATQSGSLPLIEVGNISVSRGSKLPSGISLGQVQVSITAKDVTAIIDYITYLTTQSAYAFTLDTITLPIDTDIAASTAASPLALTLAIGVYYYE